MGLSLLVAVTFLVLSDTLCLAASSGIRSKRDTLTEQAQSLIEEFWQWRLRESPEYGTKFGINTYDDQISEWTESAFIRQLEGATKLLTKARSILARDELEGQDLLSLTILKANLDSFIEGFPYRKYSMYNMFSLMDSPTSRWATHIGRMKFNTESDYRKAFSRLQKLPTYVDQKIQLMDDAVQEGLTLHAASLLTLDEKFKSEIVVNAENSTIFKKMFDRNRPQDITANLWNTLRDEAKRIILENVPHWTKIRDHILNEYAKHTRPEEGVSSLPGGLEYYKACLKWHINVDMSPEEVHQKGLDEVERISGLMLEIMKKDNFTGNLQEYIVFLKSKPENFFQTSDEMLQGYKDIIADAHGKLSTILINIPANIELAIETQPNPQGPIGFYEDPPLDGSRPAAFRANVHNADTRAKFDMVALALHEAEPGHHTQMSYSIEADMPYFRRAIEFENYGGVPFNWQFFTAYSEGWALYAEFLGEEMDAYTLPHSLFGRYVSEIFRSTRLVVDTGIHAFGWSKEKAIDYVGNYTTMSRKSIENEINRYISWPGQACAYKIGQLKISEFRDFASKSLGKNFDKREFHEEIMKLGNSPIDVLEGHIRSWVKGKIPTVKPAICSGSRSATSLAVIATLFILLALF